MSDPISSVLSYNAAKKGTKAQTKAANAANETQRYIYDTSREDQQPWQQAGQGGLNALMGLYGFQQVRDNSSLTAAQLANLSPEERASLQGVVGADIFTEANRLAASTKKKDIKVLKDAGDPSMMWQMSGNPSQTSNAYMMLDPGYQFRLSEGQRAIENGAAARGGLLSGNALKATQKYGQDYASNEFTNIANRYTNLAGLGEVANKQMQQAGQNYANAYGQNALAAGQARASGYAAKANAISGGIEGLTRAASMAMGFMG